MGGNIEMILNEKIFFIICYTFSISILLLFLMIVLEL